MRWVEDPRQAALSLTSRVRYVRSDHAVWQTRTAASKRKMVLEVQKRKIPGICRVG